jgi:Na+-driven multidrug efflux pump
MMMMQGLVNSYGKVFVAGYTAATKIDTLAMLPNMNFSNAMSSYTAQNLGAGKKERLPLGFRTGIRLSVIASLPFIVLYFFASRQMMGLFLNDSSIDAINAGQKFLHIVSPMYFMLDKDTKKYLFFLYCYPKKCKTTK